MTAATNRESVLFWVLRTRPALSPLGGRHSGDSGLTGLGLGQESHFLLTCKCWGRFYTVFIWAVCKWRSLKIAVFLSKYFLEDLALKWGSFIPFDYLQKEFYLKVMSGKKYHYPPSACLGSLEWFTREGWKLSIDHALGRHRLCAISPGQGEICIDLSRVCWVTDPQLQPKPEPQHTLRLVPVTSS